MKSLHFFHDALITKYGHPLHRIPINLYLSCPNRDADGHGGCTFCSENGARAQHLRRHLDLKAQVAAGIDYVQKRYHSTPPYLAYFQAYTNTYGSLEVLRQNYEEVLSLTPFAGIMIGTRPDCLPEAVLDYLQELNQKYDVWVELGVQTAHNRTLEKINRGHTFECSQIAIEKLHARGIKVAVHLILGLPEETPEDCVKTAEALAKLPIDGVKFHQLMVLHKTPMASLFHTRPEVFHIMNEYVYAETLARMIRILPENMLILRLNADAPSENCVAPHWWMRKGQFISYFTRYFEQPQSAELIPTEDGSFTAYHPHFRQHFHTLAGARHETEHRFILPSEILQRAQVKKLRILDIGFGLGYNALCALDALTQSPLSGHRIDTLEFDQRVLSIAEKIHGDKITQLAQNKSITTPNVSLHLHIGDARDNVKNLPSDANIDIVFLDPFSPDVNPELWSYDFFRKLYNAMDDDGCLLTYSVAFPVIGGLLRAGFHLYHTDAVGNKKPGLIAYKKAHPEHPKPLREKDKNIACHSLAGVVYRDPHLTLNTDALRNRRTHTVERLKKRGVPKWFISTPRA